MLKKGLFFFALVLFSLVVYYFQIRPMVFGYFESQSPVWFAQLAETVYPRLAVERERFDPFFFVSKADQIVWRAGFVGILWCIFSFFFYGSALAPKNKVVYFFDQKIPKKRIRYFVVLFFALSLWEVWQWHENLEAMQSYLFFYEPVFLLKILFPSFPNLFVINVLYIFFTLTCLLCLLDVRVFEAGTVAVSLMLFFHALHQGFAKTDHAYATWLYAGLFFPFLLWEARKPDKNGEVRAWGLGLIEVAIGSAYLQAGLEKLWISGGEWASSESFRAYLLMYGTEMGIWVSESSLLCAVLPIGTLFFQIFFISILFVRQLKYIFLPLGVLFHVGVYGLFGIGGYLTAWWAVYLFFVEWEKMKYPF